jgi:hypothetical protein
MLEDPIIRVFVTIDYYDDGTCVAEAISHHRACSAVVKSFSGGPASALRTLADQIDAADESYSQIPD